jgi:UDP-2,3-diacylglucosamine hydrolase
VTTLFISDLHLDADRPAALERFRRFVEERALTAQALYVLGDLFEAWIGDDEDAPGYATVLDAFEHLRAAQVACFFMHGNRDFLVGPRFAATTGCTLLDEYHVVEIAGERVLLTHGDLLCTDDKPYMALRATVRDSAWQQAFLAKSLGERREIARDLRERSKSETTSKTQDIMDVNEQTVAATMRRYGVTKLLHGHTHRPGIHRFELDGRNATRIVLGAWYEQGSVVSWDRDGFKLETLAE